ncbi:MAG: hypothetical protein NUW09_11540 [Deltaproteobacteria bacterium]|nr:hypothetical protein [Deltaproteobacteria bacterium]
MKFLGNLTSSAVLSAFVSVFIATAVRTDDQNFTELWKISFVICTIGFTAYFIHRDSKRADAEAQSRQQQAEAELQRRQEQAEAEARRKQQQYEANQNAVLKNLRTFVGDSIIIFNDMPKEVDLAENALDKAEIEFQDGAFAPFWDAVERAATYLASFDSGIRQITSHSEAYKKEMGNLVATPPPFQIDIKKLPDATRTADRMQDIVRLAQRNFQFATIYEQRKTNKLLVKGFTSLGQALSEMSSRIETSIDDLSGSISDFAERSNENARELITNVGSMREQMQSDAQERRAHENQTREMLDNIQRRKKPQ